MKQSELQQFLTESAADRIALVQRHEAGARAVSHYDFNNTYQYVISRGETHLNWLQDALGELSLPLPAPSSTLAVPAAPKPGKRVNAASFRDILQDDVTHLARFVDKWTPRVDAITHARHRAMFKVMLGELREHKRLFEQAAAGFEDLLGKRTGGVPRQGAVLSTRWME